MTKKLALFGGPKTRDKPFPPHPIIEAEEKKAVQDVMEYGRLSSFIASAGANFLGGKKVREFEDLFAQYHKVKHAVSFNSATAALHAAVVACDVQPGEEIITTPYTFTSTATCALMHNVVPVFADIREEDCNIDPKSIEKNISPLTKAIIPVHLFGNSADMDRIMGIAKKHNLKVIEDCAQAPAALYKNRLVGTIGDCGIFSFTESKTITSGEGGMLTTNDDHIADVARLVRNHGEAVVAGQKRTYNSTILGWNYRLTEVDAAIGIEQFKKLDRFNNHRIRLADYLAEGLKNLPGLTMPKVYPGNKHVYYLFPFHFDAAKAGISREKFVEAMNAEGIPTGAGYIKPLYTSMIYHEHKPFVYQHYKGKARYDDGLCPVAEKCHKEKIVTIQIVRPMATEKDMDDIINAAKKIFENKAELN